MKRFLRFPKSKKRVGFLAICIFAIGILAIYAANPAAALVAVTTSSSSTATSNPHQRKTWYDGTRYWAAILNGSDVEFWYSTAGKYWAKNSSATLTISTDQYSIQADSSNAYIAYINTSTHDVDTRKASSYPGTSFSWGSATTAITHASFNATSANITRDTSGFIWVADIEQTNMRAVKSSSADSVSSWGTVSTIASEGTINQSMMIVPLASGNVYAIYQSGSIAGTFVRGSKNTSGTWDVSPSSPDVTNIGTLSSVSKTSAGEIYLTYTKSNQVKFVKYIDGTGWGSPVTVDSSTDATPAIMLNSSTLYIYWVSSNVVKVSNATSPYTSWSAGSSVYSTGTNTNTSMPATDGGSGTTYTMWTNGSANPYSIYTDFANNLPDTTTLSSPSNGGFATTTPSLQMSATDADTGDTLKYKVFIYNTTSQSGGNCSGSSYENADQTSSGTGWSTGTSGYAQGATATYAVQAALTTGNSYCWQAQATDGSGFFGTLSTPSTFSVNGPPATPTLDTPGSSAINISVLPLFRLRTTDAEADYLTYFIQIYDATACGGSQVGGDINELTSHSGWQREDANTNQAYIGAASIGSSSMAAYQYSGAALTANHLYSWRAKAKDPGGSGTFSSLTSCQDFTTNTQELNIGGGTTIQGGTIIQ